MEEVAEGVEEVEGEEGGKQKIAYKSAKLIKNVTTIVKGQEQLQVLQLAQLLVHVQSLQFALVSVAQ